MSDPFVDCPQSSISRRSASADCVDWVLGQKSCRSANCAPCRARRQRRLHGADLWRNRHRQRTLGHADSRARPARRQALHSGQLRRADGHVGREPIVRSRKGRVYRRRRAVSAGVFRAAEGGTVFLDEVGEMPLELQPKLLRVLQQREVTPVGAAHPVPIDVQIIAATNRDLEVEVAEGRFREDLYYRLNMVELRVPPLRDRVEDIPEFIEFFSRRFAARYQRPLWQPDADTLKQFCEFPWPGNVRQLSHVIEQSYVLDCAPSLPHAGRRRRRSTSRCRSWTWPSCGSRPFSRPCRPRAATRAAPPGCWACTPTR